VHLEHFRRDGDALLSRSCVLDPDSLSAVSRAEKEDLLSLLHLEEHLRLDFEIFQDFDERAIEKVG